MDFGIITLLLLSFFQQFQARGRRALDFSVPPARTTPVPAKKRKIAEDCEGDGASVVPGTPQKDSAWWKKPKWTAEERMLLDKTMRTPKKTFVGQNLYFLF